MKSFNITMSHRRVVNTEQPANQRREGNTQRRAAREGRKAMQCPWWGCEMSLWVATFQQARKPQRRGRCAL